MTPTEMAECNAKLVSNGMTQAKADIWMARTHPGLCLKIRKTRLSDVKPVDMTKADCMLLVDAAEYPPH